MVPRAIFLALALAFADPAAAGERIAFFGVTYLDTSLQGAEQGVDPAERARIGMLEEMVRARFLKEGYELVDLAPVQTELDRTTNAAKCYGCDTRMAAKLGADYALVGEVQKVSNLILAMNLQLRDAATGTMVKGRVVDIRSNTDDSWKRGMRYILDNTFFREVKE
jgi:hypothetical protein